MKSELLIRVLAVWRITELVVEDEITRELREYVVRNCHPKLAYLVTCKRCVSVWAGFAVLFLPGFARFALAASAGTILTNDQLAAQSARAFDRRVANHGSVQSAGKSA